MAATDWEAILHDAGDRRLPQILVDTDFALRAGSPMALELLGWTYEEAFGAAAADKIHPDDAGRALDSYAQAALHAGDRPPAEFRLQHADGRYLSFDVTARSLPDQQAVLFTLQPVEARAGVELLALENVEILETLSDASRPDGPVELVVQLGERHVDGSLWCAIADDPSDPARRVVIGSPRIPPTVLERIEASTAADDDTLGEALRREVTYTGPANELLPADPDDPMTSLVTAYPTVTATPAIDSAGCVVGMVVAFRHETGTPTYSEYSIHTLAARLIGLIVDWTRQRHELVLAANQDALTDLDNRRSLLTEIEAAATISTRRRVAVLDLDRFSAVNNRLGHDAGDRILREISSRIPAAVPAGTKVFRTGGDEFTFVFPAHLDDTALHDAGETLLAEIRRPVDVRQDVLTVTGSLGVVVVTTVGLEPALTLADRAMYVSKRNGGDQVTTQLDPDPVEAIDPPAG